MRRLKAVLLAGALLCTPAVASENVGGFTHEVCVSSGSVNWPAVTASSAYSANNEVGGLITFPAAWLNAQSGIIQSIRLNFADAQTAGFKAYQFASNPSATTWTDKTGPSINAADVNKVRPPISLTSNDSGLGTHTVYGADAIARAHSSPTTTDYWLLVTTGTPTFGSTTDAQLCVTYMQDW